MRFSTTFTKITGTFFTNIRLIKARRIRAGFPEDEIGGIAFVGGDFYAGASNLIFGAFAGEFAVFGPAFDGKQHMTFGFVGVAAGDKPFD